MVLVFDGRESANGYTEAILHKYCAVTKVAPLSAIVRLSCLALNPRYRRHSHEWWHQDVASGNKLS
jgi:hypothetical protein